MTDALKRAQANEDVKGMFQKWYRESFYPSAQKDIVSKRVGWQKEKTNQYYQQKQDEAVANMDAAEAIALVKLQAVNDGELTARLPSRIAQIKGEVWFNKQKEAISSDILNYDPMKLGKDEIPPYFKDKDQVKAKLNYFRKTQTAHKKDEFAVHKAEYTDYIMKTIGTKEANDAFFEAIREKPGFGKNLYSEKEVRNFEAMNTNLLLKKSKAEKTELVNELQWEIKKLEEGKESNPNYNVDKADIIKKINHSFTDYGTYQKVMKTFKEEEGRVAKIAKLPFAQKKSLNEMQAQLKQAYQNVLSEEDKTVSAEQRDFKNYIELSDKANNWFLDNPNGKPEDFYKYMRSEQNKIAAENYAIELSKPVKKSWLSLPYRQGLSIGRWLTGKTEEDEGGWKTVNGIKIRIKK